jgi:cell division protein FtsX
VQGVKDMSHLCNKCNKIESKKGYHPYCSWKCKYGKDSISTIAIIETAIEDIKPTSTVDTTLEDRIKKYIDDAIVSINSRIENIHLIIHAYDSVFTAYKSLKEDSYKVDEEIEAIWKELKSIDKQLGNSTKKTMHDTNPYPGILSVTPEMRDRVQAILDEGKALKQKGKDT